jgi:hypothetical protein
VRPPAAPGQGTDGVELPDDATVSSAGELAAVEFPWPREGNAKHRSWTNTVLRTFHIHGCQLTVEVNSEERARLARLIRTRDGREMAEALLVSLERREGVASCRWTPPSSPRCGPRFRPRSLPGHRRAEPQSLSVIRRSPDSG